MRIKHFVVLGVMALLVGIHSDMQAGDHFFVTLQWPPLEYEGDQGEAQGLVVEIVKKVMKSISLNGISS